MAYRLFIPLVPERHNKFRIEHYVAHQWDGFMDWAAAKLITIIEVMIDLRNWLNQTFIKANRLARQTVGIFNAIILMKLSKANTINSMPSVRFGLQLNNNFVQNIKQFALLAKWTSHFFVYEDAVFLFTLHFVAENHLCHQWHVTYFRANLLHSQITVWFFKLGNACASLSIWSFHCRQCH